MSKRMITIALLSAALLGTNAWWAYRTIDFGITHTYAMGECEERVQALTQSKAILPIVARLESTREEVLSAARVGYWSEPFEKDGFVWVGRLGLKFSPAGRLIEVAE